MKEEADQVLDWAKKELAKNTCPRPRVDYQELLHFAIICLGGEDTLGSQDLITIHKIAIVGNGE